jgi:hypothetical protein
MDSFLVQINSDDAEQLNGTNLSHVQFNFKSVFRKDNHVERVLVSVDNAQIPCSFFAINDKNNELGYFFNGYPFSIYISHGNYSAYSLCQELIRLFITVGTPFSVVAINSQTGRLTLSTTSTFFIIRASSPINKILGIGNNDLAASGYSITCPNAINLLGITSIRISSTRLLVNGLSSKGMSSTSILATVPVDNASASFGLLSYVNMTLFTPVLNLDHLGSFDIQLFDQDGNYIDFRNIGWSMTLKFDLVRKEDKTHERKLIQAIQHLATLISQQNTPPINEQEQEQEQEQIEQVEPEQIVEPQGTDERISLEPDDMGDLSLLIDSQKGALPETETETEDIEG